MDRTESITPKIPAPPPAPAPVQVPRLAEAAEASPVDPVELERRTASIAKALKRFIKKNPAVVWQNAEGEMQPRIEAYQFTAACLGYSAMVTSTEEVISDKGEEMGFIAVAHELNSAGRVVSGAEAACMRSERDWSDSPSFQLRSMAQTRACGKAHRNVFAYVMVAAGLCATPAEETPGSRGRGERAELGVKCYECGHANLSDKRAAKMRKKYGKPLCVGCEKVENNEQSAEIMAPLLDSAFVQQSVAAVAAKKGAQPIVAAMEAGEEDLGA